MTKSEQTRALIIEQAAHLFNTKGYSGTSMQDVLNATGLAKGGVYGHFSSKEEIVVEAFEYAIGQVLQDLGARIKAQDNAHAKLIAILNYYYNFLEHSPVEGGCPILNYSGHMGDMIPELQKSILRALNRMLQSIAGIVEKGKQHKQIRAAVDPKAFSELFYSRIEGAIMLAKVTGDSDKLNRLLDDLKQYIEKNIIT
jgi:TetR/AcrR family transcriptional repressor of nem operon